MGDTEQKSLKKQRDKRQRVQRMKRMIVTTISLWMVLSLVVMIALCIKVASLQQQINVLTGNYGEQIEVEQKENAAGGSVPSAEYVSSSGMNTKSNQPVEGQPRKVYLTFDDGPSSNTVKVLDILKQYGVKATFFCVGNEDESAKEIYKRIVAEGHTIAMHSYTHKYREIYASLDNFSSDYKRIHDLIYDTTGVDAKYYRFPGGSSNKVSNVDMKEYIQFLNNKGVVYYDWNVSSGDATTQAFTVDELVENVMHDVVKYNTSVVLMHDAENKQTTVQALPKMIESIQGIGGQILPIDDDTMAVQHVTITK